MDIKSYADAILASWEPYMALSMSKDPTLTADDLRPITRVMYSSALISGGKCF